MGALSDKPRKLDESAVDHLVQLAKDWTPRGEQHRIEAPRGERLIVMAALLSSGQVSKPLVIVLDNASIHRAKAIRPALAMLEEQGVKFEFLSPYSPELNRIETMWRLMKHRWMAVKRRTKDELERAV